MREELEVAFARVVDTSAFAGGSEVESFEHEFAEYCGVRESVGVSSGTAALRIALAAAGVGPGDEVIVPALTFTATAHAVVAVGARPVFADVDPATGLIDSDSVAAWSPSGRRRLSRSTSTGNCATWSRCSRSRRATTSRSSRTPPRRTGRSATGAARDPSGSRRHSASTRARTSARSVTRERSAWIRRRSPGARGACAITARTNEECTSRSASTTGWTGSRRPS